MFMDIRWYAGIATGDAFVVDKVAVATLASYVLVLL